MSIPIGGGVPAYASRSLNTCSRPSARPLTPVATVPGVNADELGGLVRRLGTALEVVTGCVKTYLMQFSEAEGFSHLHVHLVPTLPNHPEDARGPRVFAYLTDDQAQWLPATDRDTIALSVRAALA